METPGARSQELIICWGYIAGLSGLPFLALGRHSNWNPPDSRLRSPQFFEKNRGSRSRIKCLAVYVKRRLLVRKYGLGTAS